MPHLESDRIDLFVEVRKFALDHEDQKHLYHTERLLNSIRIFFSATFRHSHFSTAAIYSV